MFLIKSEQSNYNLINKQVRIFSFNETLKKVLPLYGMISIAYE